MKDKKNNETNEFTDSEETTAIATTADAALSTEVSVSGARLSFPFIRLAQGMSQWKSNGRKPTPGCFYIGTSKDTNALIAEGGKENGIHGIVLQRVDGVKEDRRWVAGMGAPRRWVAAGVKPDGTPVTLNDCLAEAAKEGFSMTAKPTGEVYADSGRPVVRANLTRFCYLCMLVPLPEDFEMAGDFRVYPIGDKLYTTARYEFDKRYFRTMDSMLMNRKVMAEHARHNKKSPNYDPNYKWTINGLPVVLRSVEMTNRDGIEYIAPELSIDLVDGKPRELTAEERADFVSFLSAVRDGTASMDEVNNDSEF